MDDRTSERGEPASEDQPSRQWRRLAAERSDVTTRLAVLFGLFMVFGAIGVLASVHTDGGPPLQSKTPLVFACMFVASSALLAGVVAAAVLGGTILQAQQLALELGQARSDGSAFPPQTTTATRSPGDGT